MKDGMLYILLLGLCAAAAVMSVKCTRQTRLLTMCNMRIEKLTQQCQGQSNALAKAQQSIRDLETQRERDRETAERLANELKAQLSERDALIEKAKAYVAALKSQMAGQRAPLAQAAAAAAPSPVHAAAGTPYTPPVRRPPALSTSGAMTTPSLQGKLADGYYSTTDVSGKTVLQRRTTHATGHKRNLDGERIIKRLGE